MKYYHELITEKSWETLKKLQKELDFILIGGWAVWLYTRALKSKDIDLIVDFKELEALKKEYDLIKNERLKKYEFKIGETSVDVYLPFYSDLGLPVEEIGKHVAKKEGFQVPLKEMLLVLKQKAYQERKLSLKGQKDLIDIFSLILLPGFDGKKYLKLLRQYDLKTYQGELKTMVEKTKEIKELKLNRHQLSRRKKRLLEKLSD